MNGPSLHEVVSETDVDHARNPDLLEPSQLADQEPQITPHEVWQWVAGREWIWRTLFYSLIAAPLLVSGPLPGFQAPLNVVWPRIHSGDEPHYLVMLNSVIQDGDLDVANNYASVHAGGLDAGRSFAGQSLDHHVSWYDNGAFKLWWKVFENQPGKWARNSSGTPVPTPRQNQAGTALPTREYSWHPPGVALLVAIPAYPFRGTPAVESIALICSVLIVILASAFYEVLIDPFVKGWQQRLIVTGVVFLGTPIWHYSRTFFNEPYLMCFAVAAYALALRWKHHFLAGVCIALGIWMKPPFALLVIPLGLQCLFPRRGTLFSKRIVDMALLAFPLVISVALLLWMNREMHGSVGASPTAWQWGNMFLGSFRLLFSFKHGIIPFAPIAILALACLPRFFTRHFPESTVLGLAFVLYFGLIVNWISWHGGYCFGPRMIIPVLPFLLLPLCSFFDAPWAKSPGGIPIAGYLAASSVVFNAIGAFGCGWVWNRHPVEFIADWLAGSP